MDIYGWIRLILIAFCICAALFMMACMLMMRRAKRLTVVRRTYPGRGKKCTFVQLSDLHIAKMPVSWRNIAETVLEERPEFVVLTGDLCNKIEETGRVADFIAAFVSRVPVPLYITLGNHDNAIFEEKPEWKKAYLTELEALSPLVHVLDSGAADCDGVLLGGMGDVRTCPDNAAETVAAWGRKAAETEKSFVLATHNADLLLRLEKLPERERPQLTVTGHTHGGQIRIPFRLEFLLLHRDILPKKGYWYGAHTYHGFPLSITSGLGCSLLPIRFRSNPEIAVFQIGGELL